MSAGLRSDSASTETGHAAAAPPISVMNRRRFMGLPSRFFLPACRPPGNIVSEELTQFPRSSHSPYRNPEAWECAGAKPSASGFLFVFILVTGGKRSRSIFRNFYSRRQVGSRGLATVLANCDIE